MRQPKTTRFFTKDHSKPHYIISKCIFFIFAFAFGMFSNTYLRSLPEFLQFFETSFNFSSPTLLLLPEPVSLLHNMSEEELLWRASVVPKIHHLPSSRVPKVAFLFLTRGDLPMAPFWDEFFEGHDGLYSIYVHPDPAYNGSIAKNSKFFGRRIPSQEARWGLTNMIEAERRLIANALLDSSNERFLLVSESCIPLYNFTTIYTYLVNSNMSYVGTFYPSGGNLERYNPAMAPQITIEQWHKATQWFEINQALAVEIVSDETYFPLFQRFCLKNWKYPCISDEHYIPTFLIATSWMNNANRSVTYTDWTARKHHPASFGKDAVTLDLFEKIRYSENCTYNGIRTRVCSLFARKFLPDSLVSLMKLGPDLQIFGRTNASIYH
ncbi:glycosyltransferase BC10-like [Carex rostrata]